jgi:hypothetical protein
MQLTAIHLVLGITLAAQGAPQADCPPFSEAKALLETALNAVRPAPPPVEEAPDLAPPGDVKPATAATPAEEQDPRPPRHVAAATAGVAGIHALTHAWAAGLTGAATGTLATLLFGTLSVSFSLVTQLVMLVPCVLTPVFMLTSLSTVLCAVPATALPMQWVLRKALNRRAPLLPMAGAGVAAMLPFWLLGAVMNAAGACLGCTMAYWFVDDRSMRLAAQGWTAQEAAFYTARRYAPGAYALALLAGPLMGSVCLVAGVPVAAAAMTGTGWVLGEDVLPGDSRQPTDVFWVSSLEDES